MIRYELAGMDLADVRFAVSPLNELVLSLRAWRDPGRYPLHLPWLREVDAARGELDGEVLLALTNTRLWTPDFLTPRPRSPLTHLEDELEGVLATSTEVVAHDLAAVHPGDDGLPAALRGPVAEVLRRVVAALTGYWERCFAGPWPRMRALLEADVIHRGREMASHGLSVMFAGLAERVSFADGVVSMRLASPVDYTRSTTGVGLTLVPTLFTRGASGPISPAEPPMIMYGARGLGTLWQTERAPAPAALTGLVGAVRAGLLVQLTTPASSTELAARAGVTPAAVNQHLRALHVAGLLLSSRYGRSVLYRRSELGDHLVTGRHAGSPGSGDSRS